MFTTLSTDTTIILKESFKEEMKEKEKKKRTKFSFKLNFVPLFSALQNNEKVLNLKATQQSKTKDKRRVCDQTHRR